VLTLDEKTQTRGDRCPIVLWSTEVGDDIVKIAGRGWKPINGRLNGLLRAYWLHPKTLVGEASFCRD
jgi:hypothetical protein